MSAQKVLPEIVGFGGPEIVDESTIAYNFNFGLGPASYYDRKGAFCQLILRMKESEDSKSSECWIASMVYGFKEVEGISVDVQVRFFQRQADFFQKLADDNSKFLIEELSIIGDECEKRSFAQKENDKNHQSPESVIEDLTRVLSLHREYWSRVWL